MNKELQYINIISKFIKFDLIVCMIGLSALVIKDLIFGGVQEPIWLIMITILLMIMFQDTKISTLKYIINTPKIKENDTK